MSKEIINKKVVIIGAGPAGITSAIELKKENVDFVLIDGGVPGGKINIAPRVDNYPNYKEIPGPDLAFVFYTRLLENEIKIFAETVLLLKKEDDLFICECETVIYKSEYVIIASGTTEKKLELENEDRLFGHGISYCALCDGHFFKDKVIAVIGGGNAALKESIYLADIVNKLYVIHRRNEFRGILKLVKELKAKPNVEILTPYVTLKIIGDSQLESIDIQNSDTNEIINLKIDGLFPLVGQNPNTSFISIDGVLDDYKNIPVNDDMESINCKGLFAIGDVLPRITKQIYLSEFDAHRMIKGLNKYLKTDDK